MSDKEMAACLDVMHGTLQRDASKRPVMKSLLQAKHLPPLAAAAASFCLHLTSPHMRLQHAYLSGGAWKGQFDESSLRAIVKWTMQVRTPCKVNPKPLTPPLLVCRWRMRAPA